MRVSDSWSVTDGVSELLQPLEIGIGVPNWTEPSHHLRLPISRKRTTLAPLDSRVLVVSGDVSMSELFVAVIAFFSASIFLAHAVEAYLTH